MRRLLQSATFIIVLISGSSNAQMLSSSFPDTSAFIQIKTIPPGFYTSRLSPICKTELRMQQSLGLPLFIRLGTKEFVDYLERKPGSAYRQVYFNSISR